LECREGGTLPWVVQSNGEWDTFGWSDIEDWYLDLDHIGIDCGSWLA